MIHNDEKQLFVPVANAKLFCRVFGSPNNHPVIVLHGGPGLGHSYLLPQMRELGKDFFTIFYDQRDTGKSNSDDAWQADPLQTYIDDLESLRQFFKLQTISLLAHSWGGVLASLYALSYPEHVNKILYLNSVPLSSSDYLEFVKHRTQIVDSNKNELDAIRATTEFVSGDPKTVEKYYRIYFKKYFHKPELAHTLTLSMSREAALNNFKIYTLFFSYIMQHPYDLYADLKTLNKPSLIVACDKDVVPLRYMQHLQSSVPASKLVLIENCGHFPYIDQPGILYQAIRLFMS